MKILSTIIIVLLIVIFAESIYYMKITYFDPPAPIAFNSLNNGSKTVSTAPIETSYIDWFGDKIPFSVTSDVDEQKNTIVTIVGSIQNVYKKDGNYHMIINTNFNEQNTDIDILLGQPEDLISDKNNQKAKEGEDLTIASSAVSAQNIYEKYYILINRVVQISLLIKPGEITNDQQCDSSCQSRMKEFNNANQENIELFQALSSKSNKKTYNVIMPIEISLSN